MHERATGQVPALAYTRARYRLNLHSLAAAQKPSRGTAAYSRLVNRPAARRVAAAADLVGLTPNGATAISAMLSASALALLVAVRPTPLSGLAVAALLAAGFVMDSVDGQLARLHQRSSAAGEWLDHTVDCAKTCALHLAVLVCWYRFPPVEDRLVLLVPLLFTVVDVVCFFGLIVMPLMRKVHGAPPPAAVPPRPEHPLRPWLILPTDYGAFCWVFVLAGVPVAFVAGYGLLFALNAVVLGLALVKWWRELTALDGSRDGRFATSSTTEPSHPAATSTTDRSGRVTASSGSVAATGAEG